MATVALVGVDGAGKTTITGRLTSGFPESIRCIYMGINLESSDVSLPGSRWILRLKLRAIKRKARESGNTDATFLTTHHLEHRRDKRGPLGASARLVFRVAEAWYRQIVSLLYQVRGYTVVYDRHFLFDCAPGPAGHRRLSDRLYHWLLTWLYPHPDMVIFLDADPEVLYARKAEVPVEYLIEKRETFLRQGRRMRRFVCVDAARPSDAVFDEVVQLIRNHSGKNEGPLRVHTKRR